MRHVWCDRGRNPGPCLSEEGERLLSMMWDYHVGITSTTLMLSREDKLCLLYI